MSSWSDDASLIRRPANYKVYKVYYTFVPQTREPSPPPASRLPHSSAFQSVGKQCIVMRSCEVALHSHPLCSVSSQWTLPLGAWGSVSTIRFAPVPKRLVKEDSISHRSSMPLTTLRHSHAGSGTRKSTHTFMSVKRPRTSKAPPEESPDGEDDAAARYSLTASLDVKCDACPRNDVPLSMLYDNITPGNDLHSFQLIRKVMGDDSLTFHRIPPLSPVRSALDLGCGYGHWVSYAAQVWGAHGTKITGVYTPEEERTTPPLQDTENIKMLCHNFITEPLPLLDNSFDYVRLNDSLAAIPGERWDFVLSEVHRILSPGGRFELIHDQLYFSSINPETPVSCTFTPSRNPRDPYFDAGVCVSPKRDCTTQPDSKEDTLGDWEAEMNNCDDIERLYLDMLAQMYGVDTQPGPILADIIQRRFGGESQIKVSNAQVCLPSQHTMTPSPIGTPKKPKASKREFGISITIDWGQQDQEKCRKAISKVRAPRPLPPLELPQLDCLSFTSLPPVMSEKAAKLMGLGRTSSAAAKAKPYQPPGVVVVVHTSADGARRPMTFHPMSATELDMHASKHIHSVLSARLALEAHIDGLLEQGLPAMSREALEDKLWQYALFRRKRFNWPEVDSFVDWEPELDGNAELAEQMGRVTLSDTQSTDGLTPIRWFEIFEVTKSLE